MGSILRVRIGLTYGLCLWPCICKIVFYSSLGTREIKVFCVKTWHRPQIGAVTLFYFPAKFSRVLWSVIFVIWSECFSWRQSYFTRYCHVSRLIFFLFLNLNSVFSISLRWHHFVSFVSWKHETHHVLSLKFKTWFRYLYCILVLSRLHGISKNGGLSQYKDHVLPV